MNYFKNRTISFALLLVMSMLFFCCADAAAATATASGSCGENVTWVLDDEGTLTINGSGEMTDYSSSSSVPWYADKDSILSVVIKDGVSSIGSRAFYACSNMISVSIPDSIVSIGKSAFCNCSSLTSISIPNGMTSIGSRAFYNCSKLTSISFPESVTSIGASAFHNCSSLTSISIPNGTAAVDRMAFYDCPKLLSVTIPGWIVSGGSNEYSHGRFSAYFNSDVKEITIAEGTSSIGNQAFYNCTSLTSISIPNSVTSISSNAFDGCSNLRSVTTPGCAISGGTTYASEGTFSYYFGKNIKEIIIADGVTSIGNYAFSENTNLTSISIPDSVTSIGSNAFYHCAGLTSISLPKNVSFIGDYAFCYCYNLTSISIPNGITSINARTFANCVRLTSVSLPDSIISIGDYAFCGCSNLLSISIPDNVTFIGETAFLSCNKIPFISIPDGVISIPTNAFYDCTSMVSVSLPDSITSIANNAFFFCSSLTSISIPSGVTTIGDYAFDYCTSLHSITFQGDLPYIASDTFYSETSALKRIAILGSSVSADVQNPFPADTTVYCYESTAAESWAKEQGYKIAYLSAQNKPLMIAIPEEISILAGTELNLGAAAFPQYSDNLKITWNSSAPHIASVKDGVISAHVPGTTTITASSGKLKSSTKATVYAFVESFDLSAEELYIVYEQPTQLTIQNIQPAGATASYTWTSATPDVATIDENGFITCYSIGDTVITATSDNGISRTCNLHVREAITSLTVSPTQINLKSYDTQSLTVTMYPGLQRPGDKPITFTSSDPTVATVDENGVIHGVGTGTAIITAKAFSGLTATCTVTSEARNTFRLPKSLRIVNAETFMNANMEAVILPSGCTYIDHQAFANARDLVIYMPDSVITFADDVFSGCGKILFICESDNAAARYAKSCGIPYRIEKLE